MLYQIGVHWHKIHKEAFMLQQNTFDTRRDRIMLQVERKSLLFRDWVFVYETRESRRGEGECVQL